jgi:hypothetical protein
MSDMIAHELRAESLMYERDPSKRHQIWKYSQNERNPFHRFYIIKEPYQPHLEEYPLEKKIAKKFTSDEILICMIC